MDSNKDHEPKNPTLNKGDVMRSFTVADMEKAFEAGFNRGAEVHGSTAGWLGCELSNPRWTDWIKNYAIKSVCDCRAEHSMEALYDNSCNYCLKQIK